ncbi:MAG: tetratricopeptide repeat protein [Candidatus Omnitrophica bacterium]|nr:tetratricopeptide repeat protein [Candidatus Omnitrophota bacterium]
MKMKWMILMGLLVALLNPTRVLAVDFGDLQSRTLVTKAWQAYAAEDYQTVNALAEKCLDLYAPEAARMQADLKAYPAGSQEDIYKYWALNDVATILFVQGEAYRRTDNAPEAAASYQRIINEFFFGQAWDNKGFFWKPAEAAREKMLILSDLPQLDFGDYSSSFLTGQAWTAYKGNDYAAAKEYVDKVIELYGEKAREMQATLDDFPRGEADAINREYWALNDVGTSYYIRGKIYQQLNKPLSARMAFEKILNEYSYAQWWDPAGEGAFFQAVQAAREELDPKENEKQTPNVF